MERILVTGALGQIGSELVGALRARYGAERVVASDIKISHGPRDDDGGPSEYLDVTTLSQVQEVVRRHRVDTIFHLAALLSAVAEERPHVAWHVNMSGLYQVLEVARQVDCKVFVPSSIGAFGPSTPKALTPQDTVQRPTTMYGVTKVAAELLGDYYWKRFGTDVRGLRYPGLISHVHLPGGGTTDYAVHIFYSAVRHGRYTSFLSADTRLPMMYMPDALTAAIDLMEADASQLEHRNAFNVTAFSVTPAELATAIAARVPGFEIRYEVDPVRQAIADSWPDTIDDSAARREWGWAHEFDLDRMVDDMLDRLTQRLGGGEEE